VLSAKKPELQSQKMGLKREPPFKMTSTGKLVIPRDLADSDEPGGRKRRKDSIGNDADSDGDVDDVTSVMSSVHIGQKRKMSVASGSLRSEPQAKYQG